MVKKILPLFWVNKVKLLNKNKKTKTFAPTVKHDDGNLMFCVCFSANGTGNVVKVNGILKKNQYIKTP